MYIRMYKHIYIYTNVYVLIFIYVYICIHACTSRCTTMSLLHHIQQTADIHTTTTTTYIPYHWPASLRHRSRGVGHRMAKGASHHIHPLAMPVTWQSGRVHVAYHPPPKETGEGGLVRVKVKGRGRGGPQHRLRSRGGLSSKVKGGALGPGRRSRGDPRHA